ncbi:MAG: DUF362 domain-containing protein [Candidatus Altiarchaeota archaeon]
MIRLWRRFKQNYLFFSIFSLFWLLLRTGRRPSRINYPCQKAAAYNSYLFFIAVPSFYFREAVVFFREKLNWTRLCGSVLFVAVVGLLAFSVFQAYDRVLISRELAELESLRAELAARPVLRSSLFSPAQSSLPSPHRVVVVHNRDASTWNSTGDPYWTMINQTVIDEMTYRGLTELTGTANVTDAWHVLIPNYTAHQKIAVKVNMNNVASWTGTLASDPDIDALIEIVNSLVKSLLEAFGSDISAQDVWVYESYKTFYVGEFINRSTYNITFFSAISSGKPSNVNLTTFSGATHNSNITFRYNPNLTLALNDALVNADYLINIPIVKRHGTYPNPSATLAFKNHFGSIRPDGGTTFSTAFHNARFNRTDNCLVDIYNNTHIRDKTILVLGDAIIGGVSSNYNPPSLWTRRFGSEGTPELLFFAVDAVSADSVMADLLYWEAQREDVDHTRNYLLEAMDNGLGLAEVGNWSSPDSWVDYPNITITYQNIDFVHINFDVSSSCGDGFCDVGEACSADCGNETYCSDSADNDQDGLLNCNDGECSGDAVCTGVTTTTTSSSSTSSTSSTSTSTSTTSSTSTSTSSSTSTSTSTSTTSTSTLISSTTTSTSTTSSTSTTTTIIETLNVNMTDSRFDPQDRIILAYDIINWTNWEYPIHRLVDDSSSLFDSGDLEQGESFSFQFNNTGTINYHCQYYPSMSGTITVHPARAQMQLLPGWNLISIPLSQS